MDQLGGRFSTELGIDLDATPAAVERWFLAATLFGARIPANVALRTYRTLEAAGVCTIGDAGRRSWDDLVALLDAGGYAHYDYRTATRLQALAHALTQQHDEHLASFAGITDPCELEAALDALPGWGPTTVRIFLRELRGVWTGADPAIDPRAVESAHHLRLLDPRATATTRQLGRLAERARLDGRDLEVALVRLAIGHRRGTRCPGGEACTALIERNARREGSRR